MTKRNAAETNSKSAKMRKRRRRARATRASTTKTQACLDLLSRATGATVEEMQKATGWQPHSVRGFLAGTVKKKLGLELASTREERGRVYRVDRTPTKGAA